MNNLKKNLLLFFVIISSLQCNRFPSDKDGAPIEPLHVLKKKPKPKLIKLANPPISPLYFKYKIIDYPYSPSRSALYPSPNKKNTYEMPCWLDGNQEYLYHPLYVTHIIGNRDSTFPINSIRRIELTSTLGNFTIYNRDNTRLGLAFGTSFHPSQVKYIGYSLYYIRDYISVKIYMNKPYKDLDKFYVYWHYKIEI